MKATPTTAEKTPTSNRKPDTMMVARQRPLMRLYREEPAAAVIRDGARSLPGGFFPDDPVHGRLSIGTSQPITIDLSVHSAVGGDHDGPNPGDLLAAALAGCFDSTMRIIANRLGVTLESLTVSCEAEIDVRGTLCVSSDVPVGFRRMAVKVDVRAAPGTPEQAIKMLIAATEHCCVVMRTLRAGVDVETTLAGR